MFPTSAAAVPPPARFFSVAARRSCLQCAQSHLACDAGNPCSRCYRKQMVCLPRPAATLGLRKKKARKTIEDMAIAVARGLRDVRYYTNLDSTAQPPRPSLFFHFRAAAATAPPSVTASSSSCSPSGSTSSLSSLQSSASAAAAAAASPPLSPLSLSASAIPDLCSVCAQDFAAMVCRPCQHVVCRSCMSKVLAAHPIVCSHCQLPALRFDVVM